MGGDVVKNGVYSFTNDVWCSGDGVAWTQVTAAAQWSKRDGFAAVTFNNKMWVLGGAYYDDVNDYSYNDVWSSTDGKTWMQATGNAAWPKRFFFSAAVFDGKMWVLGGYGNNEKLLNDVWCSSDGVTWTQVTASAAWAERFSYGTVAFNNKLWIIGGKNRTGNLNDVWFLEGTSGINDQKITGRPTNDILSITGHNRAHDAVLIHFHLTQATAVRITLCNSMGREVALVCLGDYGAGKHTAIWNKTASGAGCMPCGVYLVRLETENGNAVRKIIIEK